MVSVPKKSAKKTAKKSAKKTAKKSDTKSPKKAPKKSNQNTTKNSLPVDAPALTHFTVTIPVGAEAAHFTMMTLLTGQRQISSNLIELRGLLQKITQRLDESGEGRGEQN
ncbi:hypothetical protein TrRE_jg13535 [Triparma retinervis]|uniref:Uncharacterized protein n=1 Tax=Triparma retinervis TaxID=2557542 RepID=A0A9W7FVK1_9STRA|nr:hypothetical protein TrRE_jg13535 [Triparma retinervis]